MTARRPGFPARICSGRPRPPSAVPAARGCKVRCASPRPPAVPGVAGASRGDSGLGLDSAAVRARMVQKARGQG
jgi:protein-L-isoaspartate(D-aspartate) O-methyltransferase